MVIAKTIFSTQEVPTVPNVTLVDDSEIVKTVRILSLTYNVNGNKILFLQHVDSILDALFFQDRPHCNKVQLRFTFTDRKVRI